MRSSASTVEEYLTELPEERREAIEAVLLDVPYGMPSGWVN